MARIIPEGWRELAAAGTAQRELETLARLAALPDGYTVYHGVHWTRVDGAHALFGEIDFAVVSPIGEILLIEQKSGFLAETPDGLTKVYKDRQPSIPIQIARNTDVVRTKLAKASGGETPPVDHLLYCPDYSVRNPATAGIAPERIIDSGRRDHLLAIVRQIVPGRGDASPHLPAIHKFFRNTLDLVADVGALAGQADILYTRLAGGLAHWARQIELTPPRLRVVGTAGSGKTQLALALLEDAAAAGERALYVCFNRPLADHVARLVATLAPAGIEVGTFHQFANRQLSRLGRRPDFSGADAYRRLEAEIATVPVALADTFDTLIVDEGQDFSAEWRDALLRFARPDSRLWWLEDPMQNLYDRATVELPGWAVLRADTNFRSPRDVVRKLNALLGGDIVDHAGSPIDGSEVEIVSYADDAQLIDATKRAITQAIGQGFRRDAITLLTFRGREHSVLLRHDKLGPYALRAFSGGYDLFSNPVFRDGEVLVESVYRFKGQSAPCVIFSEIDFEALDSLTLRKLFVGATRATLRLTLVVSERAAALLRAQISQHDDSLR